MNTFDLFGFQDGELRQVAQKIESLLGIQFELFNSSYKGDYFGCNADYELCQNQVTSDFWIDSTHKDFKLLLYVNNLSNMDVVLKKILDSDMGAQILSRTEVKPRQLFRVLEYVNDAFVLKSEKKLFLK